MAKRGNGQGYARKRGSTWTAVVTVGWDISEDGKAKQIRRTKGGFKTKREALAYCPKLLEDPAAPRSSESLQQIFKRWAEFYEPRIKTVTMNNYRSAFEWFAPVWCRRMDDISVAEFQKCIDDCPCGRSVINKMRVALSLVYKWAAANRLLKDSFNPAAYLYVAAKQGGTRPPFSMEELERIRQAVGVVPYADYVYAMCYLGYRPTEMLSLRKTQYDAEHRCFIAGIKTEAGKNRIVTISPKIQPIIDRQIKKPGELVFPGDDGEEISSDHFNRKYFDAVMKALGIEGRTPYSCRHTFANLLKAVSGSDTEKASLMGHADASMTRYYQSPEYERLRSITDAI